MKQNSTTRKHRTCRPSFFVFPFLFLLAFQLPAFAGVDGDIAAVLKDKLLAKATVGIHIVRLDAGKSVDIYRSNGQAPLAPASNMKLLTSSAVLDYFGPDFKFRTLLVQHGQDVILIGDGDPTIGDIEFLKKTNWTATTLFENWAKEAKKAGVDSVANVLVDDSIFDEALVHPDWDPKQFNNHYSAEVAGMTVNRGCRICHHAADALRDGAQLVQRRGHAHRQPRDRQQCDFTDGRLHGHARNEYYHPRSRALRRHRAFGNIRRKWH